MSFPNRLYLSPPHMSARDRELLLEAFDSNWIAPLGPHVDGFEEEVASVCGRQYGAAVSSGTAALHLALQIVGVEAGDCVLVSTLTFAATANAIRYIGAIPVFIDSCHETWNMDPQLLGEELERRARDGELPKALLVVDVNGQCADYQAICKLADFYEIPLIEDAAEALGASFQGRPAGSFGAIGCLSFNGNKIITTSGGGMLVTDRKEWAVRARYLASQARMPAAHYEHNEVGYNYRMSNLLAAIGRGQLEQLPDRVRARRAIFARYYQQLGDLPGIDFMPEAAEHFSSRWLTCLTINAKRFGTDREAVRLSLEEENIEARPVWKPMHLQPAFSGFPVVGGRVSEELFRDGLCLPSGSAMSQADVDRVAAIINQVGASGRKQRREVKA